MSRFQERVSSWLLACFGAAIATDRLERTDRFIEEAIELAQTTNGYSADRVKALANYVFSRPAGIVRQEVGGVMVTLAAFCYASALDMEGAALEELERIERPSVMQAIRAKQATKPHGSALPVVAPAAEHLSTTDFASVYAFAAWLTTQDGAMQIGAQHDAAPMAKAVGDWIGQFGATYAANKPDAERLIERYMLATVGDVVMAAETPQGASDLASDIRALVGMCVMRLPKAQKQTSPRVSSIAGRYLGKSDAELIAQIENSFTREDAEAGDAGDHATLLVMLGDLRTLAASALGQDETH